MKTISGRDLPANAAGLAPAMGPQPVETNRMETDNDYYDGTGGAIVTQDLASPMSMLSPVDVQNGADPKMRRSPHR